MKIRWCVLLIALLASQGVNADGKAPNDATAPACVTAAKDPNDPNELLWKKWDVVIKDPNNPNDVLKTKWDAVVKILQAKSLDDEAKAKIIDKVVSPIFNFPLMAGRVIAKDRLLKFTKPQREKFTELFTKRLKESYRDKISKFTDETVSIKPVAWKKKRVIEIPMLMTSDGKDIEIIYRLFKGAKGWKIYDVEVEGISTHKSNRAQFDDLFKRARGDIEKFLSLMEKPQKR